MLHTILRNTVLAVIMLCSVRSTTAQCPLTAPQEGDYRSKDDGLWQDAENWEAYNGQGWASVGSTAWPGGPDAQPPKTSVCSVIAVASFIDNPRLEGDLEVGDGAILGRSSPAAFLEFEGFRARNEGTIEVGTFYLAGSGEQVLEGPGAWIPLTLVVQDGSTLRLDEDLTVETTVRIRANASLNLEGHTLEMISSEGSHTLDVLSGAAATVGTVKTEGRIIVVPGDSFTPDLYVESGVMELVSGTYQGDVFVDPAGTLLVTANSHATLAGDQFLLYGALQGQQFSELIFEGSSFLNESPSPVTVPDFTFSGTTDQTVTGPGEYHDVNVSMTMPSLVLTVDGGMRVHGRLTIVSGEMELVAGDVDLGTDGRLDELPGGRVRGNGLIRATRSQDALGIVDPGIGFRLRSISLGDAVELHRGHSSQFDGGIDRYVDVIVDEAFNVDLNATIESFAFHSAELNGLDPADLALYRFSEGASSWEEMGGTTSETSIRLQGIDHFSRWTAGEKGLMPVSSDPVAVLPLVLELHAAFPNPFHSSTRIGFDVPVQTRVLVSVHDVAGRLIRTLSARDETAGRHEVHWDARDDRGGRVANGVYIVRLEANGRATSTPVVLLGQ